MSGLLALRLDLGSCTKGWDNRVHSPLDFRDVSLLYELLILKAVYARMRLPNVCGPSDKGSLSEFA